jgi:sulfite exporter TauE/SafE
VSSTVPCFRCRTVVPRGSTTLSLEGEPLCQQCAATYDAAAERKRIEGSLFVGFLWGCFLSILGIGLVYALDRKPAEKKGAVVGAAIMFGLFYVFVLPLLEIGHR